MTVDVDDSFADSFEADLFEMSVNEMFVEIPIVRFTDLDTVPVDHGGRKFHSVDAKQATLKSTIKIVVGVLVLLFPGWCCFSSYYWLWMLSNPCG